MIETGIYTPSAELFQMDDQVISTYHGDLWGIGIVMEVYVNSPDMIIKFKHGLETCSRLDISKV